MAFDEALNKKEVVRRIIDTSTTLSKRWLGVPSPRTITVSMSNCELLRGNPAKGGTQQQVL
jgi:hypothetical protein